MNTLDETRVNLTRRELFQNTAAGIGGLALASMLSDEANAAPKFEYKDPLAPKPADFTTRAKNVIFHASAGSGP